jgi:DNA transformation protein
MSTTQNTIDFLLEQLRELKKISTRKMFGEYALYCDGKVVAFVCDDQLFIKPTDEGRAFLKVVEERPPYPGAKLYFFVSADRWEDEEWLGELVKITAQALPMPKEKKKKVK